MSTAINIKIGSKTNFCFSYCPRRITSHLVGVTAIDSAPVVRAVSGQSKTLFSKFVCPYLQTVASHRIFHLETNAGNIKIRGVISMHFCPRMKINFDPFHMD